MPKEQVKAKPRRERNHPQTERVYSRAYPAQMEEHWCYVPLEDFRKLENKYIRLFKRYQKRA